MKTNKLIVCLFLAAVLVSCFAFCNQPKNDEVITLTAYAEPVISLNYSFNTETTKEFPSVVLTATITPSNAVNKAVVWSVDWAANATLASEAVTDYVTVTPQQNNSLKATVLCKKSFRGNTIVVKVTTKAGGYFATCNVNFEGKPSSLTVNNGESSTINYAPMIKSYFSVSLDNVFGDVGDDFYDGITVKSYSCGGYYTGGTFTRKSKTSMEGEGSWGLLSTYNIKDLEDAESFFIVAYEPIGRKIKLSYISFVNRAYQSASSDDITFSGMVHSNVDVYVDVVIECSGIEKTFRVNLKPFNTVINGGTSGSCMLDGSAEFTLDFPDIYDVQNKSYYYEDLSVKSFTWGGTYLGGTFTSSPSGGFWGALSTFDIADLINPVSEFISVTYSEVDRKITISNIKSLVGNAYKSQTGTSQGSIYSGMVKSDINMYVDIVLTSSTSAEIAFRVDFSAGVNSINLDLPEIIF